MDALNWHYDTAKDSGLSFVDRLKQCPREPDLLVHAARVAAAVAIRTSLRICHRFEITGRENLPRDGSFVMVANHSSHLDTLALLASLPLRALHRAHPLGARDYFARSHLRLAITTVIANVMLFDRDERGLLALKNCEQMLAEPGNVIVMFPEGTRSIDGRVGRFRRGIGFLLAGTPHPVVPCHLDGTFRAWPKGALIPRPTRVRLAIGKARTYEHVQQNEAGVLDVCSDLRTAVLALAPEPRLQTAPPISQGAYQ